MNKFTATKLHVVFLLVYLISIEFVLPPPELATATLIEKSPTIISLTETGS